MRMRQVSYFRLITFVCYRLLLFAFPACFLKLNASLLLHFLIGQWWWSFRVPYVMSRWCWSTEWSSEVKMGEIVGEWAFKWHIFYLFLTLHFSFMRPVFFLLGFGSRSLWKTRSYLIFNTGFPWLITSPARHEFGQQLSCFWNVQDLGFPEFKSFKVSL